MPRLHATALSFFMVFAAVPAAQADPVCSVDEAALRERVHVYWSHPIFAQVRSVEARARAATRSHFERLRRSAQLRDFRRQQHARSACFLAINVEDSSDDAAYEAAANRCEEQYPMAQYQAALHTFMDALAVDTTASLDAVMPSEPVLQDDGTYDRPPTRPYVRIDDWMVSLSSGRRALLVVPYPGMKLHTLVGRERYRDHDIPAFQSSVAYTVFFNFDIERRGDTHWASAYFRPGLQVDFPIMNGSFGHLRDDFRSERDALAAAVRRSRAYLSELQQRAANTSGREGSAPLEWYMDPARRAEYGIVCSQ